MLVKDTQLDDLRLYSFISSGIALEKSTGNCADEGAIREVIALFHFSCLQLAHSISEAIKGIFRINREETGIFCSSVMKSASSTFTQTVRVNRPMEEMEGYLG